MISYDFIVSFMVESNHLSAAGSSFLVPFWGFFALLVLSHFSGRPAPSQSQVAFASWCGTVPKSLGSSWLGNGGLTWANLGMDSWLVVWNMFYFPYIRNNNPNWLSYFSEGWPNHQPDRGCTSCFGQLSHICWWWLISSQRGISTT